MANEYLTHISVDAKKRDRAANKLILPHVPDYADPVWHLFVIRYPNRERLQNLLRDAGIETMIHYPIPPHFQSAYANSELKLKELPVAAKLSKEVLSLPLSPQMSQSKVRELVSLTNSSFNALSNQI